jgi:hypothetical protein
MCPEKYAQIEREREREREIWKERWSPWQALKVMLKPLGFPLGS